MPYISMGHFVMTDSNHNNPVLSYDELGFIIGMKRVEKKSKYD